MPTERAREGCTDHQLVVIKVGGSLLSLSELPQRLGAVLRQLRVGRPLIVCGGGESADIVRRWQHVHGLSDEQAHWMAFHAVSLNEVLLSHLLPRAMVIATRDELQGAWSDDRLPILAAERFVRAEEPHAPDPLPHDWSVTSDSIAAWVTRRLNGQRLVLLKSCEFPANISLQETAARNLIDSYFPTCAAQLMIDWVNFRTGEPQIRRCWPRPGHVPPSHGRPV